MIVFADHSLKSFPSAAAGLRALDGCAPDLEAVRLLLPSRVPAAAARAAAAAVAVAELALGAASLSSPAAGWLNSGVLAVQRVLLLSLGALVMVMFGHTRPHGGEEFFQSGGGNAALLACAEPTCPSCEEPVAALNAAAAEGDPGTGLGGSHG